MNFRRLVIERWQIAGLALEAKLPIVCEWAEMARDGCLIG